MTTKLSARTTLKVPELSEHQIQSQFVKALTRIPDPCLGTAFAIPNAAKRSFKLMAMLRAEGFRTGMPDWCLPVPAGSYNALWIEFKTSRGKASPEQVEMHKLLRRFGGLVHIATSSEAAVEMVLSYLRQRPV